jgi:hypothetical protein
MIAGLTGFFSAPPIIVAGVNSTRETITMRVIFMWETSMTQAAIA